MAIFICESKWFFSVVKSIHCNAARMKSMRGFRADKKRRSEISERLESILRKLFRAEDRVLGSFGDAEFHNAFCGNVDRLAGGRVAPDARLAVDENELAQAWKRESVLRIFVSELRDGFQNFGGLFFGDAGFFRDF